LDGDEEKSDEEDGDNSLEGGAINDSNIDNITQKNINNFPN
jgi:hypothetical protein